MPNRNYIKGRRKEYKICSSLRGLGYDIVQRTAGSHSPIDVIAIRKSDKQILLIQSKPDNFPQSNVNKLNKEGKWLNGLFNCVFKVL